MLCRLYFACLLVAPGLLLGQAAVTERELKAAYLFQFSQFTEWPATAFGGADAPFVIGLLGRSALAEVLTELVRGERAAGHPIEVRQLASAAEAVHCHIVYIAPEAMSAQQFAADGRPVLLVGESDDFLRQGGAVRFVRSDSRIRLHINHTSAQRRGLTLSSKLLRIAAKVERES